MELSIPSCTPQFNITFPSDTEALRTILSVILQPVESTFIVASPGTRLLAFENFMQGNIKSLI